MNTTNMKEREPVSVHSVRIEACLAELSARLGPTGFKLPADDIETYLREDRGLYRGEALAVARPANTDDVSFVMRLCAEAGIKVIPQGGNTGLVGGQMSFGGVVLSLERMNAIRNIDKPNGAITVDAGCTLKAVQNAASGVDALFPLSLASEGSCQIGGNISSNAGGTAVLRYGNMRDLVLGLEVVLPDGRIWNGLRTLRKDNSGYDLKQIFIGSEGTLGIVTGAVLKLFPAIRSRVTAFVGCSSVSKALELFHSARQAAGDVLSAFEFMPRFGIEIVVRHAAGKTDPLSEPHAFYALVEFTSIVADSNLQERMELWLQSAMTDNLLEDATIGASEAQSSALWALREEMSWAQKPEGGSIKHDVSVPVARVAEFVTRGTDLCEQAMPGIRVCAFGHMGDGNIHFNLSQPVGMDKAAFLSHWERFNRIVHDLVVSMDGSIAAEHGVGLLKLGELARYKDDVSLDLMRTLKRALDPLAVLNPGKVVAI